MTRIQQESFADPMEYEKVKNSFILNANMLTNVKPNMKILHPLPRVNEIDISVDTTPYAYYFQQAQNGLFVNQELIWYMLGIEV
jgi:aspartate carbamoyltransferase catalytic subunit